ncbi:hypothetical protein AB0M02_27755 [Actinoplanes sp. NPDC051861]|uniref:hypothetical protein n=1 Tax=Actinoplanes sp. NPDC051861 TaxID=3155170 RepID=UPI00344461F1
MSTGRYLTLLIGSGPSRPRGIQGYGLWRRYWSALLGIHLPPLDAPDPARAPAPPTRAGFVRLPRFDRAALRLAASGDPERLTTGWTSGDRAYTVRESGPGEIELLVHVDHDATAELLPADVTTDRGTHPYLLVFVPDDPHGSVAALRLSASFLDVATGPVQPSAALDTADPATITRSVAATPDPGMSGWARLVAGRPADDPIARVIRDAAG